MQNNPLDASNTLKDTGENAMPRGDTDRKKSARAHRPAPRSEAFAPLLLASVCMLICLVLTVADKFVFPFSGELLAPAVCELIAVAVPTVLYLSLFAPHRSLREHLVGTGVRSFKAEYAFLIIYSALFVITSSALLDIIFMGVYSTREGFALLGIMTAGRPEYSVSPPYLIAVFAVVPAIAEELLFRGVLFSEFKRASGAKSAAIISSVIFSAFSFSPGQIPSLVLAGCVYCTVYTLTGSVVPSMVIHLLFNLYGLYLEPNIAQYFLSGQNNLLLVTTLICAFLLSGALILGELARLYRSRAASADGSPSQSKPLASIGRELEGYLAHRPTLVAAVVSLTLYAALAVMRILF